MCLLHFPPIGDSAAQANITQHLNLTAIINLSSLASSSFPTQTLTISSQLRNSQFSAFPFPVQCQRGQRKHQCKRGGSRRLLSHLWGSSPSCSTAGFFHQTLARLLARLFSQSSPLLASVGSSCCVLFIIKRLPTNALMN